MELTEEKVKQLKTKYNKAVKEGKDEFMFEGKFILTKYAKYLLEHLIPNKKRNKHLK